MAKRKRPVYLVVKPTGVYDDDGEEAVILLHIKQTSVEADTIAKKTEGAIVRKGFVTG